MITALVIGGWGSACSRSRRRVGVRAGLGIAVFAIGEMTRTKYLQLLGCRHPHRKPLHGYAFLAVFAVARRQIGGFSTNGCLLRSSVTRTPQPDSLYWLIFVAIDAVRVRSWFLLQALAWNNPHSSSRPCRDERRVRAHFLLLRRSSCIWRCPSRHRLQSVIQALINFLVLGVAGC